MSAAIKGLGAWYPPEVRTNDAWPETFLTAGRERGDRTFNDIPQALDHVAEVTNRYLAAELNDPFLGVESRRVASDDLTSAQAEVFAAQRALADAQLDAGDIDVVISYSVTPDRLTPASGPRVADLLGASRALSWGMDAACATALIQMATAKALVESGQAKNVLLTQSHLLLRTFPLLHPAAPGLGDAATAVVVGEKGRYSILGSVAQTHGDHYSSVTWIRDEEDSPWWQAGGPFRVGTRNRDGAKALQRDTVSYAVRTLREVFEKERVDKERVIAMASVEPRGWVPAAVAEILGLESSVLTSVYRTRGHLGACGPIANLESAYTSKMLEKPGIIALYAQGAGFTRASMLLEIDEARTEG